MTERAWHERARDECAWLYFLKVSKCFSATVKNNISQSIHRLAIVLVLLKLMFFSMSFVQGLILLGMVFAFNSLRVQSVPTEVKIGGIFCKDVDKEQRAFLLGVNYINNSTSILPNTHLIVELNQTDWLNTFNNIEAVYWQIYNGVSAIIGPMTSPISLFGVEEGTGNECRNINLIKKQTPSHVRSH
jgi:hypothetical protein